MCSAPSPLRDAFCRSRHWCEPCARGGSPVTTPDRFERSVRARSAGFGGCRPPPASRRRSSRRREDLPCPPCRRGWWRSAVCTGEPDPTGSASGRNAPVCSSWRRGTSHGGSATGRWRNSPGIGTPEELGAAMTVSGVRELPRLAAASAPAAQRLGHAAEHRQIRHVPSHGDARVPGRLLGRRRLRICLTCGTTSVPQYGDDGLPGPVTGLTHALAETGAELLVGGRRSGGRVEGTACGRPADLQRGCSRRSCCRGSTTGSTAPGPWSRPPAVGLPMSAATPQAVAKGCPHLLEDDRCAEAAPRSAAATSRKPASSALVAPWGHWHGRGRAVGPPALTGRTVRTPALAGPAPQAWHSGRPPWNSHISLNDPATSIRAPGGSPSSSA